LRLGGLGCFPDYRKPRVIWCGVEGNLDLLRRLQEKVENTSADFGFALENRPFSPHLTLGRVKGKRNLQRLTDYIKIGNDLQCSFIVECFHLYRSRLTPQGAQYSVLETIELPI
jgi:2'-5' RNA ligase